MRKILLSCGLRSAYAYAQWSKVTYRAFLGVLIDLMIELLDLRIKCFDNQTDIFRDLGLIIKPFDNRDFLDI